MLSLSEISLVYSRASTQTQNINTNQVPQHNHRYNARTINIPQYRQRPSITQVTSAACKYSSSAATTASQSYQYDVPNTVLTNPCRSACLSSTHLLCPTITSISSTPIGCPTSSFFSTCPIFQCLDLTKRRSLTLGMQQLPIITIRRTSRLLFLSHRRSFFVFTYTSSAHL